MRFKILTIFPQMIENALGESILGRARKAGIIEAEALDIRTFSENKHKNTDDAPFGGGAGMVMTAQPITDAIKAACGEGFSGRRIYLSPRGTTFTQKKAEELSKCGDLVLLCGHYEGIDQRIIDRYIDEEISVGDYVLTGGELGALIITDAVARLVPGVLGCDESSVDESFSSGLLEYPQYTRPREFEGMCAPDVLLGGNQKLIDRWRRDEALRITLSRRPEMLKSVPLDKYDRAFIRREKHIQTMPVYMDERDDELLAEMSEKAGVCFTYKAEPEKSEALLYLRTVPPKEIYESGKPVYVNAPLVAGENVFSCPPARFCPAVNELIGDEGIAEVRFSGISRYEFAGCAAALLPVKRALRYRADYGKSRSACLIQGESRHAGVKFFDGSSGGYYVQKLPSAFIDALARFCLSGVSPIPAAEVRAAYNLLRLITPEPEAKNE